MGADEVKSETGLESKRPSEQTDPAVVERRSSVRISQPPEQGSRTSIIEKAETEDEPEKAEDKDEEKEEPIADETGEVLSENVQAEQETEILQPKPEGEGALNWLCSLKFLFLTKFNRFHEH